MKNKRNIFLFIIWTISCANSFRFPGKPRYGATWTLNFPNPGSNFGPWILPDLAQIFRNPTFPNPNNFYRPPDHTTHQYPNYEHYPHFPNYNEPHVKPPVNNFNPDPPFTQQENNKPQTEFESSTIFSIPEVSKPNIQIGSQETQINDNAVLVDSLNKALNKLNSLLPPKPNTENKNSPPSTENPTVVRPEVLADSLNKAIDMLTEVLAIQQANTQNAGSSFIMDPIMPMISPEQMTLTLEEALKELEKLFAKLPDELKNPSGDQNSNRPAIFGIGQFHPIFVPRPVLNGGVPDVTKRPIIQQSSTTEVEETTTPESTSNNLFTSSERDKNKNKGTQSTTSMSIESNESSESSGFMGSSESSEFMGSSESSEFMGSTESNESSEENGLFTSAPKNKNKTETVTSTESTDMLFTSMPKDNMLFTSSPKDNMLFTSPQKKPFPKTATETTISADTSTKSIKTVGRIKEDETPTTTDMSFTSSTMEPSSKEILTSAESIISEERIKDVEEPTTTEATIQEDEESTTTEISIIDVRFGNEQRSDDSIIFPDEFDEDRIPDRIAPSFIHENELSLGSRFGESNESQAQVNLNTDDRNTQQNNLITLEYRPQRPSFQPEPLVYPMPAVPHGEPLPGSSTDRNNYQQLGDRNNVPSTTTRRIVTSNQQISLEYKPSRPPFAPNPVVYPMPIFPPGQQHLGDRNNVPSTTTQRIVTSNPHTNTPISLEYKPMRPFFAGPVRHPEPLIPPGEPLPGSSTERYNQQQLGDRNTVPSTTTQRIVENTPISLEYKPMRPFFAGPVMYPQPLIPPGEPLPGSSTERNNHQQLGDRNTVPSTTTQRNVENTPITLEYKPSRPPIDPDPVGYPIPGNFQELGDRNQVSTTSRPTIRTTRRPYYTNTPIVLGYKPSRPPYVPEPWVYPSPGLIPPGTPWPASSTERPFGK